MALLITYKSLTGCERRPRLRSELMSNVQLPCFSRVCRGQHGWLRTSHFTDRKAETQSGEGTWLRSHGGGMSYTVGFSRPELSWRHYLEETRGLGPRARVGEAPSCLVGRGWMGLAGCPAEPGDGGSVRRPRQQESQLSETRQVCLQAPSDTHTPSHLREPAGQAASPSFLEECNHPLTVFPLLSRTVKHTPFSTFLQRGRSSGA